jgi:hypothetical protein
MPCPILEDVMEDIKKHEGQLGGIGASMTFLVDGQKKIFDCVDGLAKVAIENKTNISNIEVNISDIKEEQKDLSGRIQNGLKDDIAKVVVDRTAEQLNPAIETRFKEVEKFMWFPRMFDTNVKKWAVAGVITAMVGGIIFLIALSTASMWGYIKTTKFGETPGLMQSIEKGQGTAIDEKTHFHIIDGKVVIHNNDHMDSGAGAPKAVPIK